MIDRGVLIIPPFVGQFCRSAGVQSVNDSELWGGDSMNEDNVKGDCVLREG